MGSKQAEDSKAISLFAGLLLHAGIEMEEYNSEFEGFY